MSIMTRNSLDFVSRSPEQTRRVGMRLGALLQAGDLICLQGDLGAGENEKTLAPVLDYLQTAAFRTELNSLTGYNTAHSGEQIIL